MTPTATSASTCCDNGEPSGTNATLHEPISADATPEPGRVYAVPARHGRAVRLRRGQTLRIVNTHGTQVCDLWAFHTADFSEFMSMPHARAFIDRIVPRAGDPLVTNRRRPILTLITDTSPGVHDTLIAACDIDRYRLLGVAAYHDNCADNLRLALKAIGLRSGEVPAPLNLWMNIPVGADRGIRWLPTVSKPGDHVELLAELDCVVVMSACPQDIIVINGLQPRELHFVVDPAG